MKKAEASFFLSIQGHYESFRSKNRGICLYNNVMNFAGEKSRGISLYRDIMNLSGKKNEVSVYARGIMNFSGERKTEVYMYMGTLWTYNGML